MLNEPQILERQRKSLFGLWCHFRYAKHKFNVQTKFGSNDFQNQRAQNSKNTYVAKFQKKSPWVPYLGACLRAPD